MNTSIRSISCIALLALAPAFGGRLPSQAVRCSAELDRAVLPADQRQKAVIKITGV